MGRPFRTNRAVGDAEEISSVARDGFRKAAPVARLTFQFPRVCVCVSFGNRKQPPGALSWFNDTSVLYMNVR